jgi:hypothetical protein
LVGKDEEQVLGRKCRDVMGPLCNKTDCMAERSLREGATVTEEISFSLAGRDHTYKIVSVPLTSSSGVNEGVLEHFTDMRVEMEIVKETMAMGDAPRRGDL